MACFFLYLLFFADEIIFALFLSVLNLEVKIEDYFLWRGGLFCSCWEAILTWDIFAFCRDVGSMRELLVQLSHLGVGSRLRL